MTDTIALSDPARDPFAGTLPQQRFVAFVDVLGFSSRILTDFEDAFQWYKALLEQWRTVWRPGPETDVTIYSDAVLLTSTALPSLTLAVNTLCFVSLLTDALVRGGIGFGRHVEAHDTDNVYVVSEALTRAVHVEKTVRYPCVALHDSVAVPSDWWSIPNIHRPVVHFEGLTFVNPFGAFWYRSAAGRVQILKERHPEHHVKYDWFLRLYDSLENNIPLVPADFAPDTGDPRGTKGT